MLRLVTPAACVLALATTAISAEYPHVPFADAGAQLPADVDAVLAGFQLSPNQLEKIAQAKQTYAAAREKLLAEYMASFTQSVGEPEVVAAQLADNAADPAAKADLKGKIDKFALDHGSAFRTQMVMLEGQIKREIANALGDQGDQFKTELNRRNALRGTPLGAYYLAVKDRSPTLPLTPEQRKALTELLDSLKAAYERSLKEYADAFSAQMGDPAEMARIRRNGSRDEVAALDSRIAQARTQLAAELERKAAEAIALFEAKAARFLSPEQLKALGIANTNAR